MTTHMTVAGLITLLGRFDPELLVILVCDPEGNDFSPVGAHQVGGYVPNSFGSGDFYPSGVGERCLVLWPK